MADPRLERGSVDHPSPPPAIPLCPLIARNSELQSLLDLWRAWRLVTLYGQSGVGKSLLARTAADRRRAEGRSEVRCGTRASSRVGPRCFGF